MPSAIIVFVCGTHSCVALLQASMADIAQQLIESIPNVSNVSSEIQNAVLYYKSNIMILIRYR